MKKILIFGFCLIMLTARAQRTDNRIVVGTIDSIYSKTLHENRKIWVYVPNSDENSLYAKVRYPVVYLLDGDAHFYSVMGMIQQLSESNGNTVCPQMIVVGIPNTDRTRDLTPTHVLSGPFVDSNFTRTSGGGEDFTAFLEKELIPHIDSLYPTAPYKMLIGHSLGGLLVINTLINHTALFNAYLAIDPSLWWDNQKLLKQSATVLNQRKFEGKTFFLAVANTMNAGMDTARVRYDTAQNSLHIRSILRFENELKNNPDNALRWNWKYYAGDDHGSVPLIGEYDALHFIFNYYKLPRLRLDEPSFNTDSALSRHFRKVSQQMGYTVYPPEFLINQLGYESLQNKNFDKALHFFKMNIDNYPQSFNVYDSMGDFYAEKGDKPEAIKNYSRALTIREYPETRQKLDKLKSEKL